MDQKTTTKKLELEKQHVLAYNTQNTLVPIALLLKRNHSEVYFKAECNITQNKQKKLGSFVFIPCIATANGSLSNQ